MIQLLKKLITSFLLWIKPPKMGQIQVDILESSLHQDVREEQESLEVNLDDWHELIHDVFETDNFVVEGFSRADRPSDEDLKLQIGWFFKDYTHVIKKTDQLYTKNLINIEIKEIDD